MPQVLEWSAVVSGLFFFAWSCIGLYVANILRDLNSSVKELNINVAVVIERVASHEKRIEKLEERA